MTNLKDSGKRLATYTAIKSYLLSLTACAALLTIGQILSPGFATFNNIGTLLNMSAVLCVASIAQMLVVVCGGESIDLSVGPIMSMAGLLLPFLTEGENSGIPMAILVGVGLGAAVGLINGVGTQIVRIPPMIMTMIMGAVADGIIYAWTQGMPMMTMPPASLIMSTKILGPFMAVTPTALVLVIIFEYMLRKSRYGRSLYLIGSNRNAATLSGIKMRMNIILAYTLAGAIAAVAGIMMMGFTRYGNIQMATNYTMWSIAALAIGGVNMMGGKGTLIGSSLGAIVLTILFSVLAAAGFNAGVRQFSEGFILTLVLIVIFFKKAKKLQQ